MNRSVPTRLSVRAFARVEAIALVLITFLLTALLLATAPYERRTAMLNRDLTNLRQIGAWTANYANDFEGVSPSFTVALNSTYPDIRALASGTPLRQASGQAIDIIRRRTGRNSFPLPSNWLPHASFNHLILADYTEMLLPDTRFIAAGDEHRLKWLDDPVNKHDKGFWQPYQVPSAGSVSSSSKRWAYSSSFETPSAFWEQAPSGSGVSQGGSTSSWLVPWDVVFGPVPMSNTAYASQKVLQYASGSWYVSRSPQYCLVESSAVTVLVADGAAALRRTADANEGWDPPKPTSPAPDTFLYSPRPWEPPAVNPSGTDRVQGYYRWTRGRLDGRDFDGPEIDTGQK